MSDWTPDKGSTTSPLPRLRDRDLPPLPVYQPPPRRERKQRTWTHKCLGALAAYGLFSLVLHFVVVWELTR